MILGNALSSAVLASRRLVEEFTDKRDELEARLALGCASHDAARPYLRVVLRTAMTPQIESTKAVGLVFLPGAMTGLVLAGVDPLDAVLVQLALMLLILGGLGGSPASAGTRTATSFRGRACSRPTGSPRRSTTAPPPTASCGAFPPGSQRRTCSTTPPTTAGR